MGPREAASDLSELPGSASRASSALDAHNARIVVFCALAALRSCISDKFVAFVIKENRLAGKVSGWYVDMARRGWSENASGPHSKS